MHRAVTDAVHAADPEVKICMQILHSGPIAQVDEPVGPSPVKSRLPRARRWSSTRPGIEEQIAAFANCAALGARGRAMTGSR
jgi:2,4-dienoyl-CoA reductase (NADPH2)